MGLTIRPKGVTRSELIEANIGEDYWEADFSNFQGPKGAKRATMEYLNNLAYNKDKGTGILYVGPNGPGKTTLAMITLKYLSRAHWSVYATSLGELIESIQRGWKQSGSAVDPDLPTLESTTKNVDFLLIDDVGKEHRGASQFVTTVFDNLIRYRVQRRKPVFITTNYTKAELEGVYGESAMSLLEGKLLPVIVSGEDHRRTVLKKEIKNGLRSSSD